MEQEKREREGKTDKGEDTVRKIGKLKRGRRKERKKERKNRERERLREGGVEIGGVRAGEETIILALSKRFHQTKG